MSLYLYMYTIYIYSTAAIHFKRWFWFMNSRVRFELGDLLVLYTYKYIRMCIPYIFFMIIVYIFVCIYIAQTIIFIRIFYAINLVDSTHLTKSSLSCFVSPHVSLKHLKIHKIQYTYICLYVYISPLQYKFCKNFLFK